MAERGRDVLVFLLLVACATGGYAAAQATGTDEPVPTLLTLLCVAAFGAYKLAPWLIGKSAAAPPRAEFAFSVFVLRNAAGLFLCTEEPDGGTRPCSPAPTPSAS